MRVTPVLLVVASSFVACEPPTAPPPVTASAPQVALDDALVRRVLQARCFSPLDDVAAMNPALDDDAWVSRLRGNDTTAVDSDHVVLDEAALSSCIEALDGDDCREVDARCLPFSRFFVGTLEPGEACGTAFDCRGVCRFTGEGCGVCAVCATNAQCGGAEICVEGACRPPLGAGELCIPGADQCGGGLLCDGRQCVPERDAGDRCDDGQCVSGLVCGPEGTCEDRRVDGGACSSDAHCQSGRCDDDVCTPLPTSGACHVGRCGVGFRCDDGDTCVASAAGDACASSGDCASDLACVDGRCAARLAPGSICTAQQAGECVEGAGCFVDVTGGPFRCRTFDGRAALGERCEATRCGEGQCIADRSGEERCRDLVFGHRAGDACTPMALASCPYPLVCGAGSGTCEAPTIVELGGACDGFERVCENELLGARCDAGVCVPRAGEGDACRFDRRRRDGVVDDGCDATSTLCGADGVCVRADAGDACRFSCLPGLVCGAEGVCVDGGTHLDACSAP